MNSRKLLLHALHGKKTPRAPFWFMRQAGRYLPEYRKLREQCKNFLEFCYTPKMACEATLQPVRRFGMDGAIIFSDILVIPHVLGVDVRFEEGNGPVLKPVQTPEDLQTLNLKNLSSKLAPVYEALKLTAAHLPEETALIGFAGAPWTLACYTVQGKSDRDFEKVRAIADQQPEFFSQLIALFVDAVTQHAINQINAGAEVIQLFDSWAGVLSEKQFDQWVIEPTKKIVSGIKVAHPDIPIIGFPRLAGKKYPDYAKQTGVDAISIDFSVPLNVARENLQPICTVQGNLDPELLTGDKNALLTEAKKILTQLGDKSFAKNRFIFNLGHGILPHTPVENMQALCDFLKNPS